MPQAIAFFIIEQLAFSGVILSGFAQALITAAVTVGFTVGTTALLNAVFGPSRPKPSDGQQNIRIAVGSRRRHYGIVHTGGQVSFLESAAGTLAKVVTLGTGREGEILEHRLNDKPVTLVDGVVQGASYHGAIKIYTRSGDPDQTAIGELTAKFAQWTSDHRQRECAHAAIICDPVKQERFTEVYGGSGPDGPVYTQVRKAAHLYDPRLDSTMQIGTDESGEPVMGSGSVRLADPSTWPWSDNWALVTADYFAHPDGFGGGFDNVNWANIAQEADFCDQAVTTVTAETIARWRAWGSYGLASDERRQVMSDLLAAADGFCWQDADGKFNLMAGRFEDQDLVITDDHIVGMAATLGPGAQRRVSAVKVIYTESAVGYREQESDTFGDLDGPDDPNTAPQAVPLYFAPHHNQAMRVAKIVYRQLGDDRWHLQLLLNLYGLNLLGRRFCRVETEALGIAEYFKIDGLKLNLAECTVEATLSHVDPEDWEFNAAVEEGTPPLAPNQTPPAVTIPVPTGLALSAEQLVSPGGNGVAIAATWDEPPRPDLVHEVQYRPTAGGDWVPMLVDNDAYTARSGPVNSGAEYEVRIRALTLGGRASAWSSSETITPTATVALGAPTALSASGGVGEAEVTFRMPTSATLAYARLYRSGTDDFDTASQVGSDIVGALGAVIEITDTGLSAGTYYYWARAFDGAGGMSAVTGSASATVT